MIFVTVGSTEMAFPRLMGGLATLPAGELVVQHGPAEPPAGVREAMAFLPFPEVLARMEAADVVVCHAGVGSVLCALRSGHAPVVVPRLARFSETVDDHQVELAAALDRARRAVTVVELERLATAVQSVPPRGAPRVAGELPLHAVVRAALLDHDPAALPA